MKNDPDKPRIQNNENEKKYTFHVEAKGLGGCLITGVFLIVFAGVLGVLFISGLFAAAVALWLASGLVLLAIVAGLLGRRR